MANNPFRSKPSTNQLQEKIDDWGKTKFKPKKFGGGGGGSFNKHQGGNRPFNRKFDNHKGKGNFHKNKDSSYKFNQVARDAKPENATPWNKYKDEIIYKQREDEQAALQANMDSSEAKNVLKQREMNYRKTLIEQKKQEPTQWEDFGEDGEDEEETDKKNKKKSNKDKNKSKGKNKDKTSEHNLNTQSNTKFKKSVSNSVLKADVKDFISKELLDNFDSKHLNYKQKDKLRAAITKTTCLASKSSLEQVVKDLKKKKAKKEKFNNKN